MNLIILLLIIFQPSELSVLNVEKSGNFGTFYTCIVVLPKIKTIHHILADNSCCW